MFQEENKIKNLLLTGSLYIKQKEYWIKKLSDGLTAATHLVNPVESAGERWRPAGKTREKVGIPISAQLTSALLKLSKNTDLSLYLILLTALESLIYLYTNDEDIVVRSPLYTPNITGDTLNHYLLIRQQQVGELTFKELLLELRKTVFEAYENQDYPFEALIDFLFDSGHIQDKNVHPKIECLLDNIHEYHDNDYENLGHRLVFSFQRQDSQITGNILYNPAVNEKFYLEQAARHFVALLEKALENISISIPEISFLNREEKQQLIHDFNNSWAEHIDEHIETQLIRERLAEQVERAPDHVALVREIQISYKELNDISNRLAYILKQKGVGPDTIVGIMAARSVRMIIAVWAVLKAGGGYLPIDSEYPAERIGYMIKDSQADLLLANQELLSPEIAELVETIDLNNPEIFTGDGGDGVNPGIVNKPGDLAYIIYTSGSTGKARGVMVNYRNLLAYIDAFLHEFQPGPGDVTILESSFSFDAFVEEAYPLLLKGGRICIAEKYDVMDIYLLKEFIAKNNITMISCSPLLLNELNRLTGIEHVHTFISGADVLKGEYFNHISTFARVYNLYGPTETTVGATFYRVPDKVNANIPVGKPISNYQVYIINKDKGLQPVGAAGELWIGGAGVTRGYLNNPELTGEKFKRAVNVNNNLSLDISNSLESNNRLYRTGDLGRWLADGNIQFLGRIDFQVKIRGYRIELEEIRSALMSHPAVEDAAVILRDEDFGNREEFSTGSISIDEADGFLEKIKKSSPGKIREYLEKNNYTLTLEIKNDTFINPPQSHQRNWLLQRLKDEYEDDLIHLDKLTRRFVSGSQRKEITENWKTSEALYDGTQLIIDDQQVMQDWERPLMKRMAQIAAETHGDVLEVGFGMGISATYLVEMGIRSYTVIECNDDVVKQFETWRSQYPRVKIRLIRGRWQDVPDQLEMYDAIFFDTYHLNEEEFLEHVIKDITFAEHFFPTAAGHLREGGVFTYYTNEIDTFSRRHQRLVFKYFDTLALEVVKPLHPPADCHYWWADSMVAVKAVKRHSHRDPKESPIPAKRNELTAKEKNNFQLTLEIMNDTFINPPESYQRNWLIQRWKDEFEDDLIHLNKLTRRFVTGSQRKEITEDWKTSEAKYDGTQLIIDDQQVMQDWERPLMKRMAQIAAETHGDILEVGFGMGISATYLVEAGVRSYTVIECNDDVVKQFETWRSRYPQMNIRLIRGQWQDVKEQLEMYDAIFFDTYHLDKEEFLEHVIKDITFAGHFFPTAAGHLREGGIFTYYTNEIDTFSRRHQRLVFRYFDTLTLEVVKPLHPPADCHYWWADSMVAVKAVKLHSTPKSTKLPAIKEIEPETRIKGLSPQYRELMAQRLGLKPIKKEADKILVAYQVMKQGEDLKVEDLRDYLEKKLPYYMIPSYFVMLDRFPLTPGGKVDRKALPTPGKVPAGEFIAPRDKVEDKMADLWSEVLEIDKELIGIDYNFFEIGGHSIKVTILIAKIHKEFQVKIPLAQIFKTPHIRGLSQYIKKAGKVAFTAVRSVELKEYYDLSHAQKRLWVLDRIEENQTAYNVPGYYEFRQLNRDAFERAIEALIKRHEILRTTFITVNGEPGQKVHDFKTMDFKVKYLDWQGKQNKHEEVKSLEQQERSAPLNLETGPLLRMILVHIEENRYLFLFTLHHIISDGWSLDILIREFKLLYDSFDKGKRNPLTPLPIQYKDYSQWHNQQLSGEKLTTHQHYWLNRFKGEIPRLKLPFDYPRPRIKSFAGRSRQFFLNKEITGQLKQIAREAESTLFMVCLALVNVLLYRYTRQTDIIVGVPAAGREHHDLKNQIGFYVNMVPLRNQLKNLKNDPTFNELLQTVKQNTLADFEHQVYPFDRIVQELDLARDLSRNPLFDVVVTVLTGDSQSEKMGTGNIEKTVKTGADDMAILDIEDMKTDDIGTGKHDLRFRFSDEGNRIFVNIQYNPLLFKEEKIKIMKERLNSLIESIINNADEDIDNLSFLSGTEKKQAGDEDRFQGGF